MAVGDAEEVTNGHRIGFAAVALIAVAAVFVLAQGVVVQRIGLGGELPFGMYAGGFALGAWTTVAATFVANALSQRIYGEPAIALRLPDED